MLHPTEVLAAMTTPAVFISAASLLLLSTANRLGRANDRLQALLAEAEACPMGSSPVHLHDKPELILDQLESVLQRLLLLRSAVMAIYVTIALLVATSIVAGMYIVFPELLSMVLVSVGLFGTVAFLYSIVLLVREALIAVSMTVREVAYARRLLRSGRDLQSAA